MGGREVEGDGGGGDAALRRGCEGWGGAPGWSRGWGGLREQNTEVQQKPFA